MSVPDNIREDLRERLWKIADRINWLNLSPTAKSKHYEAWTRDPTIGGVLSQYISLGDVRVYLKDTLLKDFTRARMADESMPYRVLGIASTAQISKYYIKPHGRRLGDGRVICWGRASAWKAILMATYERAYEKKNFTPYAAILTHAAGRYKQPNTRTMIENAAKKLGIARVILLEM